MVVEPRLLFSLVSGLCPELTTSKWQVSFCSMDTYPIPVCTEKHIYSALVLCTSLLAHVLVSVCPPQNLNLCSPLISLFHIQTLELSVSVMGGEYLAYEAK